MTAVSMPPDLSQISRQLVLGTAESAERVGSILSATEQLSADELRELQLAHLRLWLAAVAHGVPHYRSRLAPALARGQALSWEDFEALPILTRAEVQELGPELECQNPPAAYRAIGESTTSGSTGRPLTNKGSRAVASLGHLLRLRFLRWNHFDPNRTTAFITTPTAPGKADPPHGTRSAPWAAPHGKGESIALNLRASTEEQLAWLALKAPTYLATYPSNLLALLKLSETRGVRLPSLRAVVLSSEPVSDVLGALCESVWGTRVVATYSASEVGLMAAQIPDETGYVVQSENVLVEVLDDDGKPCRPGEIGRVVVTTLHDLLRPLIRYEVGDFAEIGEAGTSALVGHPRLRRIVGRQRTMVRLPNGSRIWPFFELEPLVELHVVDQWQLVQTRDGSLVVRLVTKRPLSEAEQAIVRDVVQKAVPGLAVRLERVDAIERTARGKYVEFVSELDHE